ncbi:MAG: hypothetical protein KDA24_24260 [Deltaproteobacteria bacterium]|nr:hypothetical protein [Deltaproteobacteria bacterium]
MPRLLLGLCVLALLGTGCGRGDVESKRDAATESGGPARGGGTDFDDEPDPVTSPLAGIALCSEDGPCVTADGRGKGTIKRGQAEGVWTVFAPTGQRIAEGAMKGGKPDGAWQRWTPQGALMEEGRWVDGKPHGVWRMFRPDGSLFETVTFVDGLRDGAWVMFHVNGKPAEEMVWSKGQQVGIQNDYAPSGERLARGHFEAHRPVGQWTCFDGEKERSVPAPGTRLTPAEACGHEVE